MPEDDKPPMPPQPPTVQIPKADILEGLIRSLQTTVNDGFKQLTTNIELVANDLSVVKDRVTVTERRLDESDKRASSSSMRAKSTADTDDAQNVQLAALTAQVSTLAGAHEAHTLTVKANTEALKAQVEKVETSMLASNAAQVVLINKIVDKGSEFLSRPGVKYIAAALWTALVAYLAKKGITFQ